MLINLCLPPTTTAATSSVYGICCTTRLSSFCSFLPGLAFLRPLRLVSLQIVGKELVGVRG